MVTKRGHETHCCRRLDKDSKSTRADEHVDLNEIELLETSKELLSTNLIDCKNKLMGAEDSDAGSPGRQSKCWPQEHREGLLRKQEHREGLQRKQEHREGLPKNCNKSIVKDCREKFEQEHREGLPRSFEQEHREGLPRKLKQEHREGRPRKLKQEDGEGLSRKLAQKDREGLPRKLAQKDREGLPRKLAQKDREELPRKLAQEDREGLPTKLAQEDRDGLPRTVAKFDAGSPGRQSNHWAHEHIDGLFGKLEGYRVNLKRRRAELREGLRGKIEKVVTHEQKQVEKVATHEQKEVEKIVKGSRRVDGVLWRHQSHVATRQSHIQSNMASNSILSCTTCSNVVAPLTVGLSLKPGS